jgi:hypothetical protein
MSKPKYLITNLVYGDTYSKLFCNNHVKSLLDDTNLQAITEKYDVEYCIFTDNDTLRTLNFHPNMVKLSKLIKVSASTFEWPDAKASRFQMRYSLLLNIFHASVKKALDEKHDYVTCWVADLVVAKEFFPRILKRMEDGHGAVFVLPLRAASEAATPVLNQHHNALPDVQLCSLGLETMHPLWVACHWDNPQFTKLPFTLLWQGGGGVLARTFSTTPIIFKPKQEMLNTRGMIDGDIPALCDNPYWCTDWTDAPVIGVEPLICYYPPFANRPSSTQWVSDWAGCLVPEQIPFLDKHCYYPNKATVDVSPKTLRESDVVVKKIIDGYQNLKVPSNE